MDSVLSARLVPEKDVLRVVMEGAVDAAVPGRLSSLLDAIVPDQDQTVLIDLSAVDRLTARGASVVASLAGGIEEKGLNVRIQPRTAAQRRTLIAFGRPVPEPEDPSGREPEFMDRLAERTLRIKESGLRYIHLLRLALFGTFRQTFGLERPRFDQTVRSVVRMGVHAMPLVAMISLLIGMILALNSAPLLKQYGQQLRIADLVGLSIGKEIGPLLTAILLAGRSGSSLTAEIGTMKVSEEIDALEVMGVDPVGYLVAPRLRAMLIVLPALTIVADVVGIAGGLIVGTQVLDLATEAYLDQTRIAVKVGHIVSGLLKSVCFGIVIVTVAAHQGFSTAGGAAGVGKYTTRSVVQAIVWIIIVDAIFTGVITAIDL